jgi:uncharacterized protein (DUF342 family)
MDKIEALSTSQLCLSDDKHNLLLLILDIKEEVSTKQIIDLLKKSQYNYYKPNYSGIEKAVQGYKDVKGRLIGNTKFQSIVIAEQHNAQLSITVDSSNVLAKAKIISAFGGEAITQEQLLNAINDQGITFGISKHAIKLLIEKSKQAPPGTAYQITIAKGTPAINAHDSYFECLLDAPKEILIKSLNLQYGSFDMNNISKLISVKEGDQLMRRHPAVQGQNGMSVFGEVINHIPANDYPFEVGKNTIISDCDDNILLSAIEGMPIISDRGMEIDELLMLEGLNADSAHINHKGSLIITGDICDCDEIVATGDITVIGFIESSNVQCGGDLFVTKGILGHRVNNRSNSFSSTINCKGSLYANFIQYATINAGQDLNIKYQLLHCHVNSKGCVTVKDEEGKKGTIFGGLISAKKRICTVTLGAPAGIKTTIDLISEYDELLENKLRIQSYTEVAQGKLRDVLLAQRKLTNIAGSEKKMLLDERLSLTVREAKNQLIKINAARENNYIKMQQYLHDTHLLVLKKLHSSIVISIGESVFTSTRDYGASKIHIKNNQLIVEPYN